MEDTLSFAASLDIYYTELQIVAAKAGIRVPAPLKMRHGTIKIDNLIQKTVNQRAMAPFQQRDKPSQTSLPKPSPS